MKKLKLLSLILSILMVFSCMGMIFAQADPYDGELGEDDIISSEPDVEPYPTDPEIDPNPTDPEVDPYPTDPVYTEPEGPDYDDDYDYDYDDDYYRPTEFDEEPATYSEYENPDTIYTPGDQDYEKQEWQSLSLDVSNSNKTGGPGSFAQIKNDRSNADKTNPVWIILCILFWCLSLAAVTFAILYKAKGGRKPAYANNARRDKYGVRTTADNNRNTARSTTSDSVRSTARNTAASDAPRSAARNAERRTTSDTSRNVTRNTASDSARNTTKKSSNTYDDFFSKYFDDDYNDGF